MTEPQIPPADRPTCSIEDCQQKVFCRGWCSKHYTRWQRHGDPLKITRSEPIKSDAIERRCPRCTIVKPISEFGVRPSGAPKGYCRPCQADYDAAYGKSEAGHPKRHRAAMRWSKGPRHDIDLRKRYGIGIAEYESLLAGQGGCCAICQVESASKSSGDRRWNVDHCHTSGRVRGLLCGSCNLGIGKFGDDPALLRAAADYLERHQKGRRQ